LKPKDFIVDMMQASVWTEGFEPSTRDVMSLAMGSWSKRFDGEPTVISQSTGLPSDFPRVIITSSDNFWRIQFSLSRLDVFWERQPSETSLVPTDFAGAALEAFESYIKSNQEIRVVRMAFIVQRHLPKSQPGRELAKYFMRPKLLDPKGPLNRPDDFQLNAHKVYSPKKLPEINSWIRWRTVILKEGEKPAISVQQDLNTLVGIETPFTIEEIRRYFELAPGEAESTLKLYLRFRHNKSRVAK